MKIENFEKALIKFNDAMQSPDSNEFKVDVCIKRFEFTYEVCKKTLVFALNRLDITTSNPRETIKEAGLQGFITDIELWDRMREDRNNTSHEYDENKALEIYQHLPEYEKEFEFVLTKLKKSD